jgi:hypothetical protein
MSARRTILRELSRHGGSNGNGYTRPTSITGFSQKPERFQAAVNQLLQDRLINGTKDEEGRLAIAINQQRLADVKREMRPWFARPAVLILLLGLVAAGVAATLLMRP